MVDNVNRPILRRALSFFQPYWKAVSSVLLLTLVSTAIAAVEPLVQKLVFDQLAMDLHQPGVAHTLWQSVLLMVALLIATETVAFFSSLVSGKTRMQVDFHLRDTVISHVYNLPLPFHQRESIEALRTRIDRASIGICSTLFDLTFGILPALMYLGFTIFFMFHLNVKLALVSLLFAPLPAIIGVWSGHIAAERERILTDHWGRVFGRYMETMNLIKMVKSFVIEGAEQRKFVTQLYQANTVVRRGVWQDAAFNLLKGLALGLGKIAVIGYGVYLMMTGEVTIGTLVASLAYFAGLSAPIIGLSGAYAAIQKLKVYFEILYDILDTPNEVPDAAGAQPLTEVQGEIEFRDVRFGYRRDREVLHGVSFKIPAGTTVAIVGPSGSGKTTVIDLVNRFYDPQSGSILVDGQDIKTVKQNSLRQHIGMVLQDTGLFNDTVMNNILIGNPEATEAQVQAVARAANVESFVARMPQGFDTVVGERGGLLSGGERQRLAIARALLKNPPILVFDEASSALDSDSESLVQEAIAQLHGKKTLLVIAHRLSTIKNADLILVLEHGNLIEQGTHSELVQLGGVYSRLASWQALSGRQNQAKP